MLFIPDVKSSIVYIAFLYRWVWSAWDVTATRHEYSIQHAAKEEVLVGFSGLN